MPTTPESLLTAGSKLPGTCCSEGDTASCSSCRGCTLCQRSLCQQLARQATTYLPYLLLLRRWRRRRWLRRGRWRRNRRRALDHMRCHGREAGGHRRLQSNRRGRNRRVRAVCISAGDRFLCTVVQLRQLMSVCAHTRKEATFYIHIHTCVCACRHAPSYPLLSQMPRPALGTWLPGPESCAGSGAERP